ncbi:hypothetical protein NJC40_17520 [Pseudomonas sp. 21LCFQ02]|uniref:hypothetical protein n=1 Tax=unclassified Pseudomonas TaxID=196821 RepID=UPI0004F6D48C|nr:MULTISPECIES: hypothetical protein [unclassified Pseudomonas]MCO8169568.1 hypothetical protein [Pseudomonas sp. 21LCFQ02]MCQ9426151.1 hypothetical protein [Pseudomonas sp. LJDD11]BAP46233.1 putative uncharacterized protein [Pseudomonas sp. StFLB209]
MATAILHSIKQGAYIAIALYVVFIAVVTVTSMNPQINAAQVSSAQAPVAVHSAATGQPLPQHAS